MIGSKCRYDSTFKCFKFTECTYKDLMDCLKVSVVVQAMEIEAMKHRKMQSTTRTSVKWRRSAQYYRAKARKLEAWIQLTGKAIPEDKELGLEGFDEAVKECSRIPSDREEASGAEQSAQPSGRTMGGGVTGE